MRISTSLINNLFPDGEEALICPKFVKEVYIDKNYQIPPTRSMQKGLYFEYLILGASANEFKEVHELPLVRGGKKSVDQERIEAQVIMFNRLLKNVDGKVIESQVRVQKEWDHPYNIYDEPIIISGVLDFISSITSRAVTTNSEVKDIHFDKAVCDIKLTKDIYGKFQNGASWKYPWTINGLQGRMYKYITELPFFYWVFDYKPVPDYRIYMMADDPNKVLEMHESIRKTVEKLIELKKSDYAAFPAFNLCNNCPIKDCKEKNSKINIQIF